MTMLQAWEILRTRRERMDEAELSQSSELCGKNDSEVEYVPATGVRIEEAVEKKPSVVYGPHPPTSVLLIDSEDERENEDDIDHTHQDRWLVYPRNSFS